MEIREALVAFEQAREYDFTTITAFAPRLSDAIDIHGVPLSISAKAACACRQACLSTMASLRPCSFSGGMITDLRRSATTRARVDLGDG